MPIYKFLDSEAEGYIVSWECNGYGMANCIDTRYIIIHAHAIIMHIQWWLFALTDHCIINLCGLAALSLSILYHVYRLYMCM